MLLGDIRVGASAPSDHCRGSPCPELGFIWGVPTCSWDRLRHPSRDPTRDKMDKKKNERKEQKGKDLRRRKKEKLTKRAEESRGIWKKNNWRKEAAQEELWVESI